MWFISHNPITALARLRPGARVRSLCNSVVMIFLLSASTAQLSMAQTAGLQPFGAYTQSIQLPNDPTTTPVVNEFACWNGQGASGPGLAAVCGGGYTVPIGIVVGSADGNYSSIVQSGPAQCLFAGVTHAGDFVTQTAGQCVDSSTYPTGSALLGVVLNAVSASPYLANVYLTTTVTSPVFLILSTAPTTSGYTGGVSLKSGGTASGQSGNVTVSTGGAGGTTPTGSLTLSTGANTSSGGTGGVTIDVGASGSGAGAIQIGTSNASMVSLGSSAGLIGFQGNTQLSLGSKYGCTHGTNATCGVVALGSAGTATVTTTAISSLATSSTAGAAVSLTLENCMSCATIYVASVSPGGELYNRLNQWCRSLERLLGDQEDLLDLRGAVAAPDVSVGAEDQDFFVAHFGGAAAHAGVLAPGEHTAGGAVEVSACRTRPLD